jgi:hypothetical protein
MKKVPASSARTRRGLVPCGYGAVGRRSAGTIRGEVLNDDGVSLTRAGQKAKGIVLDDLLIEAS